MDRSRQKLNSERGASMLLALLFLFFCLAIGAIVLTAATATGGRQARIRTQQQEYLSVQSAARTLRDELQSLKFTGTYTSTMHHWKTSHTETNEDGSTTTTETWHQAGPTFAIETKDLTGSPLNTLLATDYLACYKGGSDIPSDLYASYLPATHSTALSVGDADAIDEVEAQFRLESDFTLVVTLRTKDTHSNTMTLTFTPMLAPSSSTTQTGSPGSDYYDVTHITKTVTYTSGKITKGGMFTS